MAKRLMLKGSTLRARPLDEKVRIKEAFMARFWTALEAGRVRPVIDRRYPIQEAEAAHAYMRENRNIGKLVLSVGG
jgi:NADPH:quinone reductase-like Zn-dependent oxidoreductase